MLKEAQGVKRFVIKTGKTDLRYGIDRLASIIRMEYGLEPLEEGTLFCVLKRTALRTVAGKRWEQTSDK